MYPIFRTALALDNSERSQQSLPHNPICYNTPLLLTRSCSIMSYSLLTTSLSCRTEQSFAGPPVSCSTFTYLAIVRGDEDRLNYRYYATLIRQSPPQRAAGVSSCRFCGLGADEFKPSERDWLELVWYSIYCMRGLFSISITFGFILTWNYRRFYRSSLFSDWNDHLWIFCTVI